MNKIIKSKFYCKNGSKVSPKNYIGSLNKNDKIGFDFEWKDRFIEGEWYEGEYEIWPFEDGFKLNGGWRRYWVINEMGIKEQISRPEMKLIFELEIQNLRNIKIQEIIK